jgi:hypothetical protein
MKVLMNNNCELSIKSEKVKENRVAAADEAAPNI